jgi:hypothetical protein
MNPTSHHSYSGMTALRVIFAGTAAVAILALIPAPHPESTRTVRLTDVALPAFVGGFATDDDNDQAQQQEQQALQQMQQAEQQAEEQNEQAEQQFEQGMQQAQIDEQQANDP